MPIKKYEPPVVDMRFRAPQKLLKHLDRLVKKSDYPSRNEYVVALIEKHVAKKKPLKR